LILIEFLFVGIILLYEPKISCETLISYIKLTSERGEVNGRE